MNYPGMKHGEHGYSLDGIFAAYPKTIVDEVRGLKGYEISREPYIARVGGTAFPWRVMVVPRMMQNCFVMIWYINWLLRHNLQIFLGLNRVKVAWDWWNDWNLYNVDFRAGINNETYKYYIDFASKFGIEYVILDEGWAVPGKSGFV